jgi:hypothetical protein
MTLYLVGNEESAKANSWWAMTNSESKAQELLGTLEGATTIKAFEPKEQKHGSNKR